MSQEDDLNSRLSELNQHLREAASILSKTNALDTALNRSHDDPTSPLLVHELLEQLSEALNRFSLSQSLKKFPDAPAFLLAVSKWNILFLDDKVLGSFLVCILYYVIGPRNSQVQNDQAETRSEDSKQMMKSMEWGVKLLWKIMSPTFDFISSMKESNRNFNVSPIGSAPNMLDGSGLGLTSMTKSLDVLVDWIQLLFSDLFGTLEDISWLPAQHENAETLSKSLRAAAKLVAHIPNKMDQGLRLKLTILEKFKQMELKHVWKFSSTNLGKMFSEVQNEIVFSIQKDIESVLKRMDNHQIDFLLSQYHGLFKSHFENVLQLLDLYNIPLLAENLSEYSVYLVRICTKYIHCYWEVERIFINTRRSSISSSLDHFMESSERNSMALSCYSKKLEITHLLSGLVLDQVAQNFTTHQDIRKIHFSYRVHPDMHDILLIFSKTAPSLTAIEQLCHSLLANEVFFEFCIEFFNPHTLDKNVVIEPYYSIQFFKSHVFTMMCPLMLLYRDWIRRAWLCLLNEEESPDSVHFRVFRALTYIVEFRGHHDYILLCSQRFPYVEAEKIGEGSISIRIGLEGRVHFPSHALFLTETTCIILLKNSIKVREAEDHVTTLISCLLEELDPAAIINLMGGFSWFLENDGSCADHPVLITVYGKICKFCLGMVQSVEGNDSAEYEEYKNTIYKKLSRILSRYRFNKTCDEFLEDSIL